MSDSDFTMLWAGTLGVLVLLAAFPSFEGTKIVSEEKVGSLLNTEFDQDNSSTIVISEDGKWLVRGVLQAKRGASLSVKIQRNNTRLLCIDGIPKCYVLEK